MNTKDRRAVSGYRHGRARGEHLSETLPTPIETRAERALIRFFGILAALAWPAGAAVIAARASGALPLAADTFATLACWVIALGCLGLGVSVMRNEDPRTVRAFALLDFGNPALDELLRAERTPWRSRLSVRIAFGTVASACWLVSVIYSVQVALGVYTAPLLIQLFTLIWILAAAIWSTVIVVTAPAECRRAAALRLACDAHRVQRERRQRLEQAATDAADTGEIPRLHQGDVIDYEAERSRRGRCGA